MNATTVFDLKARPAALTETSIITRKRGPVSFDEIVSLGTRSALPAIIAELTMAHEASAGGLAMS
jgi:hypothetical protein